ncbi:nucleoside hydrolase [Telmatocola sphagniphila]|uniref:Nucleoside hydrolase n=1 Tax=Telmatocola sphagniphila TaxID=1123043 RepID=A0A8E6B829_9BACT|nr:nucleoside hydrolase [Telmatocola sphagniphila]QVL32994.1 nucleoside hydrolase [Telmatocola sphagniphila]
MPQKIVLIADPGIDTSFAIALALHDPEFEVVAIIATAGNISAAQATRNVQVLINQIDPPKWPRLGGALPVDYEIDGKELHGPEGLGGFVVPDISLHSPLPGDKLLNELVREYPKELRILCMGPATILARAIERDPDLPNLIESIVLMGGTWLEPGNSTAAAEFHFACDPAAAKIVLHSGATIQLLTLDISRKLIFSPSDLLELPASRSGTCQFLRQIIPFGIRASSNLYGIEGFHLKDVLAIAALALPACINWNGYFVDVETRGELTRGALVVDNRPNPASAPNVLLGMDVDVVGVRDYILRTLSTCS